MGKTKRIVEDMQESTANDDIKGPAPADIATPKTVTIVGISPEYRNKLVGYLETRPYSEVSELVSDLKKLTPFPVTFNG